MMKYRIPTYFLTQGQIRNLLSFGKWGMHKTSIEFYRWEVFKAMDYIGKSILHAIPEFMEYERQAIAISGSDVYMEYYDTMTNEPIEVAIPLKWCLQYLQDTSEINSYAIHDSEPERSQVTFTFDINLDQEQTATDYVDEFMIGISEAVQRQMLFAWHLEGLYDQFKSIQQPIEIAEAA